MGSPITFSGFNNIDFNAVLEAISKQDRIPVQQLETEHRALQAQQSAFGTFATKLAALESAAQALGKTSAFDGRSFLLSNSQAISASISATAAEGTYEIVVDQLARAQVTSAATAFADKDTTIVASGGTLTVGDTTLTLSGDVTLQGLADAINTTSGLDATASIVRNSAGYQLVLTGKASGAANAFTITNNLSGGAGIAFSATNTQNASDAAGTVNGVAFTSTTNTLDQAVPGTTLTLMQQNPGTSIVLTITSDTGSVKGLLKKFVDAYNDVSKFIDDQQAAAGRREASNIGRDPLLRGLRSQLANALTSEYTTGGAFSALSQVGFGLERNGQLTFDEAAFGAALTTDRASVESLFRGVGSSGVGAFDKLQERVAAYTAGGGLVPNAKTRLTDQMQQVSGRIDEMERRLSIRRESLQKEFIAADLAMSQLNAQLGQLNSMQNQFRLF